MSEEDRSRGGDRAAAFAELGARSNFSLLDGASHSEELVEAAAALGLAGLAVCNTSSFVRSGLARAGVGRGRRWPERRQRLLDEMARQV